MAHLKIRPFTINEAEVGDTWQGLYGLETRCRVCGKRASVVDRHWDDPQNGTVGAHSRSEGGRLCDGVGAATDLEAALRRDSRLNVEEERVHSGVTHFLMSCPGHWPEYAGDLAGEFCGHPKCGRLLATGKRKTLMGWR